VPKRSYQENTSFRPWYGPAKARGGVHLEVGTMDTCFVEWDIERKVVR
jgi:hypothetical protein